MRTFGFILALLFVLAPLNAQHLIGLSGEKLEKEIKTNYPSFARDNTFVNHTYHYLKYVDKVSDQTLLVFLNDQHVCTSTKLMCDYAELDNIRLKLKNYKQIGKDRWMYKNGGTEYVIRLNREEWFFSLFTSKK